MAVATEVLLLSSNAAPVEEMIACDAARQPPPELLSPLNGGGEVENGFTTAHCATALC